jgi:hypothetical protein
MRVTIYAKAVNSTDDTLPVRFENNVPQIRDASGAFLRFVAGSLSASGTAGAGLASGPNELGPGGTVEAVTSYDLLPDQVGLQFLWDLGDNRKAKFTLP